MNTIGRLRAYVAQILSIETNSVRISALGFTGIYLDDHEEVIGKALFISINNRTEYRILYNELLTQDPEVQNEFIRRITNKVIPGKHKEADSWLIVPTTSLTDIGPDTVIVNKDFVGYITQKDGVLTLIGTDSFRISKFCIRQKLYEEAESLPMPGWLNEITTAADLFGGPTNHSRPKDLKFLVSPHIYWGKKLWVHKDLEAVKIFISNMWISVNWSWMQAEGSRISDGIGEEWTMYQSMTSE
ncbi:hypothetical protein D3C78_20800 [compost metagenome]